MFLFDDDTCFSKEQRLQIVCVKERDLKVTEHRGLSLKGAVKALCGTQGFRYTKRMLLLLVGLKIHSQLKYRLDIFNKKHFHRLLIEALQS